MKKNKLAMVSACAALAVTAVVALNDSLTTRLYEVRSEKVREPVRLVLLTDLHSCAYGAGQRKLLDAVEAQHPDLVLLGGDIVDDDPSLDEENAWTVVRALAERYPTFYVTGNHEFWGGRPEELKRRMEAYGATVLEGACETVIFQGQPLGICGVDDPAVGEESWEVQLDRAAAEADPDYFNILLTHRPERVDRYEGLRPGPGGAHPRGPVEDPRAAQWAAGAQPGLLPPVCGREIPDRRERPDHQPGPCPGVHPHPPTLRSARGGGGGCAARGIGTLFFLKKRLASVAL